VYFWYAIRISASDVTISGFTITNCNGAISLDQSETGYKPISGVKIVGNYIQNNSDSIYGTGAGTNLFICKNNVTNNDYGIRFSGWSDSLVSENNIIGNEGGLSLASSSNVTIKQNNIVGNSGGLFLGWSGPFYVYDNNITDNRIFGIEFEGSNNSTVNNNNIMRNEIGIRLLNYGFGTRSIPTLGSGNSVYYNNLIDNVQNIFVQHAAFYNVSTDVGNGTDIVSWDNGLVGNYWSDYGGQGTYVIDENNVDHHPLTQQVDISTTAPTPLTIAIIAIIVVAIGTGVGLLVYFKKRKH